VTGANFGNTTASGFTKEQLNSTASYQAGDLRGVWLERNDLSGWNLGNQNHTNTNFYEADLTGTDVAGAPCGRELQQHHVEGFTKEQLYSTVSYQAGTCAPSGWVTTPDRWNLANQDLTNANFASTNLTAPT
jgi:uncharacterized protein YjbI with pentapeptide repeats